MSVTLFFVCQRQMHRKRVPSAAQFDDRALSEHTRTVTKFPNEQELDVRAVVEESHPTGSYFRA